MWPERLWGNRGVGNALVDGTLVDRTLREHMLQEKMCAPPVCAPTQARCCVRALLTLALVGCGTSGPAVQSDGGTEDRPSIVDGQVSDAPDVGVEEVS